MNSLAGLGTYEGESARKSRSSARLAAATIKNVRRPRASESRPTIGAPRNVAKLLKETRMPTQSALPETMAPVPDCTEAHEIAAVSFAFANVSFGPAAVIFRPSVAMHSSFNSLRIN